MTDQELDIWEKENSFVSYRSVVNQANNEWHNLKSTQELNSFLYNYRDVLTLKDSLLTPHIDIKIYQSIVNREGIYKTYGYINKIIGDYIVTGKIDLYNKLCTIKHIDGEKDIHNLEKQGLKVFKYINSDNNTSARTNGSCSTQISAEYFYNQTNCRNDRKLMLYGRSYVFASPAGDFYQSRAQFKMVPVLRRGTFCNWDGYSTLMAYKNVSFTISGWGLENGVEVLKPYFVEIPDYTGTLDEYTIVKDIEYGDKINARARTTAYAFTSFHAEGTSRGIDNNWVVLDCQ
ncbi:hypothetical protein [Cesiribacter sp. SM1]|uniref:hypothetical protein n=1 Tax=Cesiribacter sp. SM1 TaxID=2861196 RepID=UPI001CD494E0|nr:hypothetical protein [Cesiribacter sp. SM1]